MSSSYKIVRPTITIRDIRKARRFERSLERTELFGSREKVALEGHRRPIKPLIGAASASDAGYPRNRTQWKIRNPPSFSFPRDVATDGISLPAVYSESDSEYGGMTSLPLPRGSQTCSAFFSGPLAAPAIPHEVQCVLSSCSQWKEPVPRARLPRIAEK